MLNRAQLMAHREILNSIHGFLPFNNFVNKFGYIYTEWDNMEYDSAILAMKQYLRFVTEHPQKFIGVTPNFVTVTEDVLRNMRLFKESVRE